MAKTIYDVTIIGGGVSGIFAATRLAEKHKNTTVKLIEFGAGFAKRRKFLEGYLGSLFCSDGKFYPSNLEPLKDLIDGRKIRHAYNWVSELLEEAGPLKLTKDVLPSNTALHRIQNEGYAIQTNDYYQWRPDPMHKLSRILTERMETAGNIDFSFNNEVYNIHKKKNHFVLSTEEGDIKCKKVLLCAGRSGWRWVNKLYKDLGLIINDNYARFGARLEISASYLKDFNKSHCTLTKDNLILGPFSFNGSIIPEDHGEMSICNFRSNEDRWKTDKVCFSMTINKYFKNEGVNQTNRIAQLGFLLSNDRIGRERIKDYLKNKESDLNLVPEYQWMKETFVELDKLIPNLTAKGYFNIPDVVAMCSEIRLGNNLESEVEGLFVSGESANIKGLLGAMVSGTIAADSMAQ